MATILKNLLRPFLIDKQELPWKARLLADWEKVTGNLYTKVMIEKIYDDTLVLGVYDSCWMQELNLLSPLLIANINANLDQPRIKNLRFKLVQPQQKKKEAFIQQKDSIKRSRSLSSHEEKALNALEDPTLREALKNYLFRCSKENS